jgi:hypothetical protein
MQQPLLDVAAGSSSLNAELTRRGYHALSVDPLYQSSPEMIATAVGVMQNQFEQRLLAYVDKFQWTRVNGPEDLLASQHAIADTFIRDYPKGLTDGRYINGLLPILPFNDYQFTMSLCANFIFDGPYQDYDFQLAASKEGDICTHLGQLMLALQADDYGVEVREVAYHMQKNGNAMLRVWSNKCVIK